jgi:molybdopterin-binding protein
MTRTMTEYRLGQAAQVLGVSVDTVRRLADQGQLRTTRTRGGQRLVAGAELARLANAAATDGSLLGRSSARNHLLGIVTRVVRDKVVAQVELRCGPFRMVSLLTRESVDDLGLEPGVLAHAVVKATHVVVELAPQTAHEAGGQRRRRADAPRRKRPSSGN